MRDQRSAPPPGCTTVAGGAGAARLLRAGAQGRKNRSADGTARGVEHLILQVAIWPFFTLFARYAMSPFSNSCVIGGRCIPSACGCLRLERQHYPRERNGSLL